MEDLADGPGAVDDDVEIAAGLPRAGGDQHDVVDAQFDELRAAVGELPAGLAGSEAAAERDLDVVGLDPRREQLGDAGRLAVGEQVVVIGSPMGFEFTVHGGAISNLQRTVYGLSYLQVEAKVNPGNSGGRS